MRPKKARRGEATTWCSISRIFARALEDNNTMQLPRIETLLFLQTTFRLKKLDCILGFYKSSIDCLLLMNGAFARGVAFPFTSSASLLICFGRSNLGAPPEKRVYCDDDPALGED